MSQIAAFLFSIFNDYWGFKPMVYLRLVYYRFTTDCYDWFGFIYYIILVKQGVLNSI